FGSNVPFARPPEGPIRRASAVVAWRFRNNIPSLKRPREEADSLRNRKAISRRPSRGGCLLRPDDPMSKVASTRCRRHHPPAGGSLFAPLRATVLHALR